MAFIIGVSSGVDPTLAALLPLAGVVLGAFLGGIARWLLDQRRDQVELKAAGRVMYEDLWRVQALLHATTSVDSLNGDLEQRTLRTDGWAETRLTLARLDRPMWDTVRTAVAACELLLAAHAQAHKNPMGVMAFHGRLDGTRAAVDEAETALGQYGAT